MKKSICPIFIFCFLLLITGFQLAAQPSSETTGDSNEQMKISNSQREPGVIILDDLVIAGGKLKFRTATGGCTDAGYFKVHVKKEKGLTEKSPHYVLTIERIKIDECKAFFPDGVEIEYDLAADLGLTGNFTISVTNRIMIITAGM